jgi:hypothetical protein
VQAIGGIVTALNCVLCAVIGVRLLRLGARTRGPEAWLGVYFLGATVLGSLLSSTVYMSWADPALALPAGLRRSLHALHLVASAIGLLGVCIFTQRVFRPGSRGARRAVIAAGVLSALSLVGVGLAEGFEVRVVNAPPYWVGFAVREAALVWMAVESFLYFGQLRRRQRLGLVDPLLANRFLLFGLWAGAMSVLMLSDPLARVWYWWLTGTTTDWVPEVGRPIIVALIAVASALGAVTAATLFLAFFPTAGYRRWVARRAAPTS